MAAGDIAATTRLDRCSNLERHLRRVLLARCGGSEARAAAYLIACLSGADGAEEGAQQPLATVTASGANRVGTPGDASFVRPEARAQHVEQRAAAAAARAQEKWSQVVERRRVAGLETRRRAFVAAVTALAGEAPLRRTVHASDLDFMFGTLYRGVSKGAVAGRCAARLFPDVEPRRVASASADLTAQGGTVSTTGPGAPQGGVGFATGTSAGTSAGQPPLSGASGAAASVRVLVGPFNDAELRKKHAMAGRSVASNSLGGAGAMPPRFLLRYRQCASPVPVPSWFAAGGEAALERMARASARAAPAERLRRLHVLGGAGRVDGRAIPIVTHVLNASAETQEQLWVAGMLVVCERPAPVLESHAPTQIRGDEAPGEGPSGQGLSGTLMGGTLPRDGRSDGDDGGGGGGGGGGGEAVGLPLQRQRRFTGHLNAVTALALSPCGRFVASASVGPTQHTSVLLAWRLNDGAAANPLTRAGGASVIDGGDEDNAVVGAVLRAGGGCVVARGCFEGGVGCLAWSLDGRTLVAVGRDLKNTMRGFHVRPKGRAKGSDSAFELVEAGDADESSGPDPYAVLVCSGKSAGSARGGIPGRSQWQLFAQRTMDELPPVFRWLQFYGPSKFLTVGEKGHIAFWTMKPNDTYLVSLACSLISSSKRCLHRACPCSPLRAFACVHNGL